jgi:hypothetical protein
VNATQSNPTAAWRRTQLLTGFAAVLMILSAVLAVTRPAWLLVPLQDFVASAGVFAPLVFVLLVVIATPFHTGEVLVVMSLLFWPFPFAFGLSIIGSVLGSLLTAVLFSKISGAGLQGREGWPPFLQRMASKVSQRPLLIGVIVRAALGTGTALEAFFAATNYSRVFYLVSSSVGIVLWVAQKLVGVVVARAAFEVSPWLLVGLLLTAATVVLMIRHFRRG